MTINLTMVKVDLLKKQDAPLQGLRLTLSQEKEQPKIPNGMQIVYIANNVSTGLWCPLLPTVKMKSKYSTLYLVLLMQKQAR